ncbi:DMT family transporter [Priestia megaterium]|uniref:DMT family transporter n=1 Tax=Priestia megaterium TaxID=1404 RepID=UPI002D7F5699|nr:DMT family transporter [Priestia megaterium]MEB4860834.1 DMT family transporter [Priestia megaterium]
MGIIIVVLTLISGAVLGAQSAINPAFAKKAGSLESVMVNYFFGAVIMGIVVVLFGKVDMIAISEVPTWQLLCVFFGVGYVVLTILSVPKIGVSTAVILVIVGQLTTGMVVDNFGWFENSVIHFDLKRLIGVVLMLIALYFSLKTEPKKKEAQRYEVAK